MQPKPFAPALLAWHDLHGRHDLPWQKNRTPYRVWVSEIMLQQTQVATVIGYYQKFMKSFPSVKTLALADQDQVLNHWSGLGYYARARNLHQTAQIVHTKYSGQFPTVVDQLCELPGIGRSTAGAILSLASEIRAPILDGNVRRVLARYCVVEGDLTKAPQMNKLWELAEHYTPLERVADYNQAMMDLGATLCTRSNPQCKICPLAKNCQACLTQRQTEFPQPKLTKQSPIKQVQLLLIRNSKGEFYLKKRPPVGIWGGLWSFPEIDKNDDISDWCENNLKLSVHKVKEMNVISHQFSHFRLEMTPILLNIHKRIPAVMESSGNIWYKLSEELPGGIAAPIAKLLKKLRHEDDHL